jgi:hypothetical protein
MGAEEADPTEAVGSAEALAGTRSAAEDLAAATPTAAEAGLTGADTAGWGVTRPGVWAAIRDAATGDTGALGSPAGPDLAADRDSAAQVEFLMLLAPSRMEGGILLEPAAGAE